MENEKLLKISSKQAFYKLIMGAITVTEEFSSSVPASRLFKALILDADNLIPKIAPQAIKNVEIIEGDGGPGTIKQMNFAEGMLLKTTFEFKYVKHKIDALDKENMSYSYTLIEGDALMNILESISYEIKIESSSEGGTKGKNISTYNTKPGVEIKEEDIKAGKEKAAGVFKAVEAYLLANPDAYVN
ncbi:Major allergen Pru ar 1 [Forsythia ovata]|uniref:Major allergen Pru ar 1 n=1 Tax=Forsythia ovata TaxID=205694 RepID=A0ABD1V1S5_9LAMI